MLTLRLDEKLTDRLDDFARRTGATKSDIAREAISQYLLAQLDRPDLDRGDADAHLQRRADESRFERFQAAWDERAAHYVNAAQVADWIDRRILFSRNDRTVSDRVLTGFNEVVGFTSELDDSKEIFVIVRHRGQMPAVGADRYHYHVIRFSDWIEDMRPNGVKSG